jgi:uncharacterized protein (DUF488 family)
MSGLLSVGHGTASATGLAQLLTWAGVTRIVDIRTAPGSRRHPQFNRAAMEEWLPAAGISYRWERELGGFRRPQPDSPNTALRNEAFRGYADYMRSSQFWTALDSVLAAVPRTAGKAGGLAMMCSESVWWRCHRRLVADACVLGREVPVTHLMHDGRLMAHPVTDGARLGEDGLVIYDGGQLALG